MRKTLAALLLASVVGCDPAPDVAPPIDCAVGDYNLRVRIGAGDCTHVGLQGPYDPFRIVEIDGRAVLECEACDLALVEFVGGDAGMCEIDLRLRYPYRRNWGVEENTFQLIRFGDGLTGTGVMSVTSDERACEQSLVVLDDSVVE